jgi:uncharacterized membrane protein
MTLPDSLYKWLKWICVIVLPALASLIVGLSKIWNFETLGTNISQTITLVATFLGCILCISNYTYYNKKDNKS